MTKAVMLQALPVPTHECQWLCSPHTAVLLSEPLKGEGQIHQAYLEKNGMHQQGSLQITTGGYLQPPTLPQWDVESADCPSHVPAPPHPPLTLVFLFSLFSPLLSSNRR